MGLPAHRRVWIARLSPSDYVPPGSPQALHSFGEGYLPSQGRRKLQLVDDQAARACLGQVHPAHNEERGIFYLRPGIRIAHGETPFCTFPCYEGGKKSGVTTFCRYADRP